jgi:hypothetical protein
MKAYKVYLNYIVDNEITVEADDEEDALNKAKTEMYDSFTFDRVMAFSPDETKIECLGDEDEDTN